MLFDGDPPDELPEFQPFNPHLQDILPDSELGQDIHSSNADNASHLRFEDSIRKSHIDSSGDVDVFKMRVHGDLTISLHSDDVSSLQLEVFDAGGSLIEGGCDGDLICLSASR